MNALFDTNVLAYALDKESEHYSEAKRLIQKIIEGEVQAFLSPQILLELYSIITNPSRTARPFRRSDAIELIQSYSSSDYFQIVYPAQTAFSACVRLVQKYELRDREIFDAHVVATCMEHNILHIYSADTLFSRFEEVRHLNPFNERGNLSITSR